MRNRLWQLLAVLALVASLLQVLPFVLSSASRSDSCDLPPDFELLAPHYAASDYEKAWEFNLPFLWGGLANGATKVLALLAIVTSRFAARIEERMGTTQSRWPARILFLVGLDVVLYLLLSPFRLCKYCHFHAFGLSDLSLAGWLRLLAVTYPVGLCAFVLKYSLIFCTIRIFRRWWWVAAAVVIFMTFNVVPEFFRNRPIHPEWELSPLSDGDYRNAMVAVAEKAGIDLEYTVEARSKRENTVNIMLCGHAARKYVVLTDTFLEQFSPAEAAVALAHELGHHRRYMRFLVPMKMLGFVTLLAALGLAQAVMRLGKRESATDFQALPVVVLCSILAGSILAPVGNSMSRRDERQADRYALELTRDPAGFVSLLAKGARINLEPTHGLPSYRRLFLDHPSVLERVAVATGPRDATHSN